MVRPPELPLQNNLWGGQRGWAGPVPLGDAVREKIQKREREETAINGDFFQIRAGDSE